MLHNYQRHRIIDYDEDGACACRCKASGKRFGGHPTSRAETEAKIGPDSRDFDVMSTMLEHHAIATDSWEGTLPRRTPRSRGAAGGSEVVGGDA